MTWDVDEKWVDVEIDRFVEPFISNLKPLKHMRWLLKPLLRVFGKWLMGPVLLHYKAMCANCHTRFYCLGFIAAAAGITGPQILERYERGVSRCRKVQNNQFGIVVDNVYTKEMGRPIMDGNVLEVVASRNKPYLLYVDECLQCNDLKCPVWSLDGIRLDKLLDGLVDVLDNCNKLRQGGYAMKGVVVNGR